MVKKAASHPLFSATLLVLQHIHTLWPILRKVDRFPVPPKTFIYCLTSSISRQFCVCVAHCKSRIADLFQRADKLVKVCCSSSQYVPWYQALLEEYSYNVLRNLRFATFAWFSSAITVVSIFFFRSQKGNCILELLTGFLYEDASFHIKTISKF